MNTAFGPRMVLVMGVVLAAVSFGPDSLLASGGDNASSTPTLTCTEIARVRWRLRLPGWDSRG
jgi:hypothetical protein